MENVNKMILQVNAVGWFKSIYMIYIVLFLVGWGVVSGCDNNSIPQTGHDNASQTLCQFATGQCQAQRAEFTALLGVSPVSAPSGEPLTFTLTLPAMAKEVKLQLQGRDMFMGRIPVPLTLSETGQYQGQAIYGACASGYMVWRAMVTFSLDGKPRTVWFDFLADAPLSDKSVS